MKATVTTGEEALERGDWAAAREHFEAAIAEAPTGAAYEGLGWTAWWLYDGDLMVQSREAAYRAYRAEGDALGAARVATWVAADHREFRGDEAVGSGWLGRAHRLLDDLPQSEEHGWLALMEVSFALGRGDVDEAVAKAQFAAALGRAFGVPDLEAVGLAQEGVALVVQGDVTAGMRRLDEASTVARGEDLRLPVSFGWALCYLITACEDVGDFPRAGEWCDAMREYAERWKGRQFLGICRTAYGRVLATRGDWSGAEEELQDALKDLLSARPGVAASGFVRLGDLRMRQGRIAEARELFTRAGAHPGAILGLGDIALDEGDAVAARDAADRVLRRLPSSSVLERLPALELKVRALASLGSFVEAGEVCGQYTAVASRLGTPYLKGRAHWVAAILGVAHGAAEQARRDAEDAVDLFLAASAPHEANRARFVLAQALALLDRPSHAVAEASVAREAFLSLGAARCVELSDALLSTFTAPADVEKGFGELTSRELEVLRLVASGLGDAEIASRLVVSPHTVHRHVANIRSKLRLSSRAAAVAYASRAGLL
jgi:DNA-binding NarL/FixJ family response regulator